MTNAARVRPEMTIDLGGKEFICILDTEAFCILEEETGVSVLSGETWDKLDVRTILKILWAAVQRHQPGTKIEELRALVDPRDFAKILNFCKAAFERAVNDETAEPDPKKKQ